MALKSLSLPLLTLSLLVPFVLSAEFGGRKPPAAGGWRPITDLKAADVQEVAQFAVAEHNKEVDAQLKYQSVVRGEKQVVAGTNYRLVIAAKDGTVPGNYEAVVWVKPWQHFRNLTSFRKLLG